MILTITIRDAKARRWDEFWQATTDAVPHTRFSFQMTMRSVAEDGDRIIRECKERMRLVKKTLREEEAELSRRYQVVHDCKSHKAVVNARKTTDRYIAEIDRIVRMTTI